MRTGIQPQRQLLRQCGSVTRRSSQGGPKVPVNVIGGLFHLRRFLRNLSDRKLPSAGISHECISEIFNYGFGLKVSRSALCVANARWVIKRSRQPTYEALCVAVRKS